MSNPDPPGRIVVVDDDPTVADVVGRYLVRDGHTVECVHDGYEALRRVAEEPPDLIVLDLMLPGMSGIELLRQLRQHSDVPVLILTAKGEDVERILGLEIGADDYLPKPFNPRELIARIRAILRRSLRVTGEERPLFVGDLQLHAAAREVYLEERPIVLTSVEFTLLEALVREAGRTVSRERLTEIVLGRELRPFDRVIDVHVSNLRRKLGNERIKTVRGSGYLFVVRAPARHG